MELLGCVPRAVSEHDSSQASANPTSFRAGRERPELKGVCVLLVEDDDDARDLLCELLTECGCKVCPAASVSEAMDSFVRGSVELIVSDIGMPDEDGYALLRRIRALSPEEGGLVPAVALTAFTSARDKERARQAGFQNHLGKPVHLRALLDVMAALVVKFRTPTQS